MRKDTRMKKGGGGDQNWRLKKSLKRKASSSVLFRL